MHRDILRDDAPVHLIYILHCADAQDIASVVRASEIALMSGQTVHASENIGNKTAGSHAMIMACCHVFSFPCKHENMQA
jgi:hypothetical protein